MSTGSGAIDGPRMSTSGAPRSPAPLPSVRPPALPDGAAHVWLARWPSTATATRAVRAWALPLVDDAERARAARRATPALQLRQLAASALVRVVLARYLDAPPSALTFAVGAHGKPSLASPDWRWLRFNLSHSADVAVVAVAAEREIGVDVECAGRPREIERLAGRFFARSEAALVHAAPPGPERERVFYRLWTLKEAYLKAVGAGLTVQLDGAEIALADQGPRLVHGVEPDTGDPARRWSLAELSMDADVVGALAVAGPLAHVEVHRWPLP